jgi:hypothetical protein
MPCVPPAADLSTRLGRAACDPVPRQGEFGYPIGGNHGPIGGNHGPIGGNHGLTSGNHGLTSGNHGPIGGNHGLTSGNHGPIGGNHRGSPPQQAAPPGARHGAHAGPAWELMAVAIRLGAPPEPG